MSKETLGIKYEEMPFNERRSKRLGALALGDQEKINKFFEKHNM